MSDRVTHLLVDGENIDATLGGSVLGRRPQSDERPRWDRLIHYSEDLYEQPVNPLFFLAAHEALPMSFVQALLALGYRPIPLRGEGKVVDLAIQRTAEALQDRDDDVILVSHDADFVPQMTELAATPGRRTAVFGFQEFMASGLRAIPGIEVFDLEYDVNAFTSSLPRIRIIEIDEFNPLDFI